MIEVKHLTKRYGKHTAVDDISFTVQDGCIYGLLGPNGAGKSTTMNMITGYLAPTGGTVAIDGHDVQEEPKEAKACIGYLPEIPPLYTDMTVQEYLLFVSELKGKKKKADRVQDVAQAVQRAGLQEMEKRLIRNLSKGYRQRSFSFRNARQHPLRRDDVGPVRLSARNRREPSEAVYRSVRCSQLCTAVRQQLGGTAAQRSGRISERCQR